MSGITLLPMAPGMPMSPETILTANLLSGDVDIYVADTSKLPAAPNYATIGKNELAELVYYTSKDATVLHCETLSNRGVDVQGGYGVVRGWASGTSVSRCFTNLDYSKIIQNLTTLASGGRLDPITKSVAIATTDAATGKTDSVDLTCSYGQISRIRVRSDLTAGQQSGPGTFQVNNSAGITAAATTIAIDTASAGFTLASGDEIWIDNECILCGLTTSATSIANATRAYAGTIATIHQDNVVGYKANEGLTLDLYSSSARVPAERLLRLSGIMTESLITSAAISAGDHVVKFSTSPIVVSDVGRGSLFRVIDTTSDLVRVQDAYGAVSESGISAYANSITTSDVLTAHDTAKNVQRIIEYDIPLVPFKFVTGTTLYLTLIPMEKISATVNATIEFIIDQFGA